MCENTTSELCLSRMNNWRRQWHPTPVLLPGKSHGWSSLVGYSAWGRKESDMTEWLHFHFSLSCIGEGNGNRLQCSCLENPRDGEPGGLPSMGSHRVGHDWGDLAAAAAEWTMFYNLNMQVYYDIILSFLLIIICIISKSVSGTSLVVQWLRLCASNAGGMCIDPWWDN